MAKRYSKQDLIAATAARANLTKKDTEKAINAAIETITDTLTRGEAIQLIGFGTFEVRYRNSREGRNPRTGEKIQIDAYMIPAFKPGKMLKDRINQK